MPLSEESQYHRNFHPATLPIKPSFQIHKRGTMVIAWAFSFKFYMLMQLMAGCLAFYGSWWFSLLLQNSDYSNYVPDQTRRLTMQNWFHSLGFAAFFSYHCSFCAFDCFSLYSIKKTNTPYIKFHQSCSSTLNNLFYDLPSSFFMQ